MENKVLKNENVEDVVKAETVLNNGKIHVERKSAEWKGQTIFEYYIERELKGKKMRCRLVPAESKDVQGYDVMDLVFLGAKEVEFIYEVQKNLNYATGEIEDRAIYTIKSVDEEGMEYIATVKPFKRSDKDTLRMIMQGVAKVQK